MKAIRTLASYLASERAAEDYCNEVVDGAGRLLQVDRVVSVSALPGPGPDLWLDSQDTDSQYRRFLQLEI